MERRCQRKAYRYCFSSSFIIFLPFWNCNFVVCFQIREGDEVDVIKGFHPTNPENLLVSRIEVLSTKVDNDEEFIILIARRTKSLTIENYPSANCYKSSEQIS